MCILIFWDIDLEELIIVTGELSGDPKRKRIILLSHAVRGGVGGRRRRVIICGLNR